jgi:hypothetical protein
MIRTYLKIKLRRLDKAKTDEEAEFTRQFAATRPHIPNLSTQYNKCSVLG